jgi:hypothetical protein
MFRSSKKQNIDPNEVMTTMNMGTDVSTTTPYPHHNASNNHNNSMGGTATNDENYNASFESSVFVVQSSALSSRSLSGGSANSATSRNGSTTMRKSFTNTSSTTCSSNGNNNNSSIIANNHEPTTTLISSSTSSSSSSAAAAMTSCLPPVILTRSIPDGDDDKYGGYKNYTSAWKKACGCYNDNSPRPVMHRACSRSSSSSTYSTSSTTNNNTNGRISNALQQRFMIFISILAFVRVSNTFYMYKTSLDQVLQGQDPSNMAYGARHLSSLMNSNNMMIYYQGNFPLDNLFHVSTTTTTTPLSKKKKASVTYDQLLQTYNIPSSTRSPYDISTAMRQDGFDPWRLINDNEIPTRIQTIQNTYREQRQQRTRPPAIMGSSDEKDTTWTVVETFSTTERQTVGKETIINISTTSVSHDTNNQTTTTTTTTAAAEKSNVQPHNWKELCTEANLSKTSRVIITNALSVSIGAPLTLLMAKQCGVKNIMIVDSMFPNTKRRRLVLMDTYRILFRNVLTLQLTNPTNTAGLGKVGSESPTDWMEKFEPTHILHLEDLDHVLDSETHWGEYMSSKGQQLMHLQSSILPLQQIMNYVHHKETKNKLNILHVSMSSILSDPTVTANNVDDESYDHRYRVEHLHKTSVTHDVNAMMADYLHTMQQFRTSRMDENNLLQMHHLKLPNVYGPIMNGKLNDRNKVIHDNGNSLYLDDAMASVFKALHISQSAHRQIMSIPSSQVRESNSAWRQELTHAYEMQMEYPFGGIEAEHYLSKVTSSFDPKTYTDAITWVNDLYGINKARFPCASSCVADMTNSGTCDSSIWDTVYPVSQLITKQCTNVMYYVNLDPQFENLSGPPSPPSSTNTIPPTTTSNDLCRIAFVSGSSPLVRETLQQQRREANPNEKDWNDTEALRQYNGKLIKNGWTLVWISESKPNHNNNVSERDRSLIRIDPSRFFATYVQKAMYVEADRIMILSNDEIMDIILSNTIHEEHLETYYTTELRDGFDDLYRTIEHPPSSARTVTMLGVELPIDIRPNNPAQYIELLSNRVSNVKGRHLNYYKQMNHYIQVDMNRPVEDSDGSSPFLWLSRDYWVHDMHSPVAHLLRCQWYNAHMYWGPETIVADSEELSWAYVIAKQRVEGRIGYPLMDDPSWFPQWNPYSDTPILNSNVGATTTTTTTEAYIRVMKGESSVAVEADYDDEANDGKEGDNKGESNEKQTK